MTATLALLFRECEQDAPDVRMVQAVSETGTRLGSLYWRDEPGSASHGEALMIDVEAFARRRGIATALWHYAHGLEPALRQGPARTPEGAAWARVVTPEQDHSYTPIRSFVRHA